LERTMSAGEQLLILIGVFVSALLITRFVLRLAVRFGLVDRPSSRSSHSEPTPRGGGLAIVVAFYLALLMLYLAGVLGGRVAAALTSGGSAIAIVGFIDDRGSLPVRIRFLVHVGAAVAAVIFIGVPSDLFGGIFAQNRWAVGAICVVAIVWATNLFNFMDGIDGIAALEAVFFASASAGLNSYFDGNTGLTSVLLCVASASLGFLVWNWPPARIFMGDVGSGFLGFALASCVLAMSWGRPAAIVSSLILGGVFVVDASLTLLRRIARGDRWFEAHRMHAYQHLAQRWRGHRTVTLAIGAINVGWLLPWAYVAAGHPNYAILSLVLALLPLTVLAVLVGAGTPRFA
jgi:Fuc2NAc and GlcNAc transferase